tara:strand:- start:12030 stop:12653 length:624 start_codon:yes stop_codon:yes gene_type:complete
MSQKTKISIVILWLFIVSGIIGITSPAKDWFLPLTPLNLSISFILVLIHLEVINKKSLIALSIPFFLGFISEVLGVNFGFFFGSYDYGENLGFKIVGVPFMIGINWVTLTVVTADFTKKITNHRWKRVLLGAVFMTILDALMEVSAPRFDFWQFEGDIVPIQNYIAWFCIASLAHWGYQSLEIKTNRIISMNILASFFLFFAIFIFV